MSAFWVVFLLCSLLTPSQGLGIMSSVAKVDVGDSRAKRDLGNLGGLLGGLLGKDSPVGGLLGGDGPVGGLLGKDSPVGGLLGGDGPVGGLLGGDGVLGSLLGRDSAVGSLLGRDGPVGGLLGKDSPVGGLLGKDSPVGGLLGKDSPVGGLLGKDGPVGGLLGKDGPVGGLLGGDGVLGSLLGRDSAVGSLLGKDGPVGGLLGKDGPVGSLLGGDGVVGGLLDKDGVVGSLLDKDGVVGGLLDKDGVVGGLLDKDGVLGGLLGKDGLVDGLLDIVLDLLIGKDGVLGKNGLVGNLLGGNVGELTGLKIVNNTLPKISLRSLSGFGHEVSFNTQLLVESTSVPGMPLCVQVEADVVILVQDNGAALQNNDDCKTFDINIRVRPKVPLLDQPLKSLLSGALRDLGCSIVNTELSVMSTLLGSGSTTLPLGALGDLPPFSIISDDVVHLDLKLPAGDMEGGMVGVQVPPISATLVLATGHPLRLSISPSALSNLLEPVHVQGAFNSNITSSMVSDNVSMSTAALLPLIPQLAKILPGSLPLELRVRAASEPKVTVMGGRATASLKASVDIISPSLQSSQKRLFSLDTDIVLNVKPSVSEGKLQTSLDLNSITLTGAPPRLDPLSLAPLAEWLRQVLGDAYIPAINDALHVSVPLPNTLNISSKDIKVDITDADNSPDLKGSCSGGASTLLPM